MQIGVKTYGYKKIKTLDYFYGSNLLCFCNWNLRHRT